MSDMFDVIEGTNPLIEKMAAGTRGKVAFSEDARIELAKAVHRKATTVTMDGRLMEITYFNDLQYVYVEPVGRESLPCGSFPYEELERRVRHT